jgi:hypothetical protein
MSDFSDLSIATAALQDPTTSARDLAAIATAHHALWPDIIEHGAIYPGLMDWIELQADVDLRAGVEARREELGWAKPEMAAPAPESSPPSTAESHQVFEPDEEDSALDPSLVDEPTVYPLTTAKVLDAHVDESPETSGPLPEVTPGDEGAVRSESATYAPVAASTAQKPVPSTRRVHPALVAVAAVVGVLLFLAGGVVGRVTASETKPTCRGVEFPFTDMTENTRYFAEVCNLLEKGLVTADDSFFAVANDDGTISYDPWARLTRAQMAVVLYRMAGSPEVDLPAESPFGDVAVDDPTYRAIVWLAAEGYVSAEPKDGQLASFSPARQTTRRQFAIWVYKEQGSPEYTPPKESPFDDIAPDTDSYKEMCWMAERGLVATSGSFGPSASLTHLSLAVYMSRLG